MHEKNLDMDKELQMVGVCLLFVIIGAALVSYSAPPPSPQEACVKSGLKADMSKDQIIIMCQLEQR